MKTMKLDGWEMRLSSLLEEVRDRPFEWGKHDCCLFAADAVAAMTSTDPATELRGTYDSEQTAYVALAQFTGYVEIEDAVDVYFALDSVPGWRFAQRGDIALLDTGSARPALGVVDLSAQNILAVTEKGLTAYPITNALRVWRC